MSLFGKKIIVTNPVLINPYYKKGDVFTVSDEGKEYGFTDEYTIITECGHLLIKTEYKLLEEE